MREPDAAENLVTGAGGKTFRPGLANPPSAGWRNLRNVRSGFLSAPACAPDERKVFELDARERGNFQHEVLKIFHERLLAEGKRWRDLTPAEARERDSARLPPN